MIRFPTCRRRTWRATLRRCPSRALEDVNTEYHLEPVLRGSLLGAAGLMLLCGCLIPVLPLTASRVSLLDFGLFIGCFSVPLMLVAGALIVFATTQRVRLILTPDGPVVEHLSYVVRTKWDHVYHIGRDPMGLSRAYGLLLVEPAEVHLLIPWLARLVRLPHLWGERKQFIPLSPFGEWQGTDLERALRHFAPHLFN